MVTATRPCGRCGAPSVHGAKGLPRCQTCRDNPKPEAPRRPRRSTPKARTLSLRELVSERRAAGTPGAISEQRPRTRGECAAAPRPCPWVGCKYHLYLDAARGGGIRLNFPHLEVDDLEDSCALDVADRGEQTLDLVGRLLNVSRQAINNLEDDLLDRLRLRAGRLR